MENQQPICVAYDQKDNHGQKHYSHYISWSKFIRVMKLENVESESINTHQVKRIDHYLCIIFFSTMMTTTHDVNKYIDIKIYFYLSFSIKLWVIGNCFCEINIVLVTNVIADSVKMQKLMSGKEIIKKNTLLNKFL